VPPLRNRFSDVAAVTSNRDHEPAPGSNPVIPPEMLAMLLPDMLRDVIRNNYFRWFVQSVRMTPATLLRQHLGFSEHGPKMSVRMCPRCEWWHAMWGSLFLGASPGAPCDHQCHSMVVLVPRTWVQPPVANA